MHLALQQRKITARLQVKWVLDLVAMTGFFAHKNDNVF
jgi:hypothetical protein